MLNRTIRNGFLAGLVLLAVPATPLLAAGGGGGGGDMGVDIKPADPDYRAAEKAIQQGQFDAAIDLLQRVLAHDARNADAYNYLGYANRKLGHREAALGFYRKALEIDPRHLGANEYLGELYLEMGDLPKAEERLSRLDDLCLLGCSQYTQLKRAVRAYKEHAGT